MLNHQTIQSQTDDRPSARKGEQGFLLLGVIVLIALVLIILSVAAPIVAKDLRRERELEAVHRGQQYVHAIRLFHLKTNAFPANVKQLEKTNNERYLRQHYLDPMTGKDDWKLIAVGQAKTTVKGFFGQPLAGLATGGLGSASGLSSGVGLGGNTGGTSSAFGGGNSLGAGTSGDAGTSGGAGQGGSASGFGSSSFGQAGSGTPGNGAPGSGTSGNGTSGFGTSGNGATGDGPSGTGSDSPFGSGSTGPFLGIGIPKDGPSILTLNEQTNYSTWEFIYDPRIEQLYAKTSIFGGGIATQSGGLGSASSLSSTPGSSFGGSSGSSPGSSQGSTFGSDPGTAPTGSPTANPGSPAAPNPFPTQNPQ